MHKGLPSYSLTKTVSRQERFIKMKSLFFTLTLFIGCAFTRTASADPIQAGCYVSDEVREQYSGSYTCTDCSSPTCMTTSDGFYSWLTPANTSTAGLVNTYGDLLAMFIVRGYDVAIIAQKQASLIKRLRKACGTRCKSLK